MKKVIFILGCQNIEPKSAISLPKIIFIYETLQLEKLGSLPPKVGKHQLLGGISTT